MNKAICNFDKLKRVITQLEEGRGGSSGKCDVRRDPTVHFVSNSSGVSVVLIVFGTLTSLFCGTHKEHLKEKQR